MVSETAQKTTPGIVRWTQVDDTSRRGATRELLHRLLELGRRLPNNFFLGSTITLTWWYLCIALTHMHMAVQAFEAFWTCAGVNASISM